MTTKIATLSGRTLTRGTTYATDDVPALAAALAVASLAEHAAHGAMFTFLGWGTTTGRPTFACTCGARLTTPAETNPRSSHEIGCAVASGLACDCGRRMG